MSSATSTAVDELGLEAAALGISLESCARTQFASYIETLLLWGARLSLTGANTAQVIVRDHILDSLHLAHLVADGWRVADIGSGAGFPAVPLAIVRPNAHFDLIESRRKRANFLREVARQSGLGNLHVVEDRAESYAAKVGRTLDMVTSRAFGTVEAFLTIAAGMLKAGGKAVAMKGPRGQEESRAASTDFGDADVIEYRLRNGAHHLLLIFPRR